MARVFVTGATGVLGRRVVVGLISAGHEVTGIARTDDKAEWLRGVGATPARVDIFDRAQVRAALVGHDAVAQLATHIPTGDAAADPASWEVNHDLRGTAAPMIAAAAHDAGARRFVQESITFPYVDSGEEWVTEQTARVYPSGQRTVEAAEAAAASFTDAGGTGVVLRFALFMAPDSAHTRSTVDAARRGAFDMRGDEDAYVSLVHIDDAAAAVLAALDVPAGVYNVAEPNPVTRADHRRALARLAGRDDLDAPRKPHKKVDGQLIDSLARSHRISSRKLQEASDWRARVETIGRWGDTSA